MNELIKEKERLESLLKELLITGRIIKKQAAAAQMWHLLTQELNKFSIKIGKELPQFGGLTFTCDMNNLPDYLEEARSCYPRMYDLLSILDDWEFKYKNYKIRLGRINRKIALLNNNNHNANIIE